MNVPQFGARYQVNSIAKALQKEDALKKAGVDYENISRYSSPCSSRLITILTNEGLPHLDVYKRLTDYPNESGTYITLQEADREKLRFMTFADQDLDAYVKEQAAKLNISLPKEEPVPASFLQRLFQKTGLLR